MSSLTGNEELRLRNGKIRRKEAASAATAAATTGPGTKSVKTGAKRSHSNSNAVSSLTDDEEQPRRIGKSRRKDKKKQAASAATAAATAGPGTKTARAKRSHSNSSTMSNLTDNEDQGRRIGKSRRKDTKKQAASAAPAVATPGPATKSGQPGANLQSHSDSDSNTVTSLSQEQRRRMEENEQKAMEKRAAVVARNAASLSPGTKSSQPVAGTCVMAARDRFVVDIGYNEQLEQVFRTIKGHQYDSDTKKWTFPITEHSALLSATECFQPMVEIGPLPPFVLRIFQTANPEVPRSIPPVDLGGIDKTLVEALMPFQREGVQFGISRNGRCLIGDDGGTGKSIQALGIAQYYYEDWPLLIVCPSAVMRQTWKEFILNWLPSVCAGAICLIETAKAKMENAQVIITSCDMLRKRSEDFLKCGAIIMDESYHLGKLETARTKAAIPLMENAKRLILLSGTPALSGPIELFTQISSINGDLFPTLGEFVARYCAGNQDDGRWDLFGSSNLEELQLILEETIMIRRLKSDVLPQLPEKIRNLIFIVPTLARTKFNKSLTDPASKAFEDTKDKEKRERLLEYYYSQTALAKMDAVTAYLRKLIEGGKKFICFAYHKPMMEAISTMLEEMKIGFVKIDGSTSTKKRETAVDDFQHREDVRVALLSIGAASSGIALTAANLVIFAELYWNPGVLLQAEDRAHRIGQLDSVTVDYLVAKDTMDEVLWPLLREKLKVLNKAGLSKENFGEAKEIFVTKRKAVPQQTTVKHENATSTDK